MLFFYRTLMVFAALFVVAIGGSWLADKYDVGPDLGWWGQQPDWLMRLSGEMLEKDGIPASGRGSVSIPFGALTSSLDAEPRVVPVFFGVRGAGSNFGRSFASSRALRYLEGGSCSQNTVNLLLVSGDPLSSVTLFKDRVFLPRYFFIAKENNEFVERQFVYALVVRDDTNQDGFLDCGDHARLEIVPTDLSGNIEFSDRQFTLDNVSRLDYDEKNDQFIIEETEIGRDRVTMRTVKISRVDLSVSEIELPDLLSEARGALNRVD